MVLSVGSLLLPCSLISFVAKKIGGFPQTDQRQKMCNEKSSGFCVSPQTGVKDPMTVFFCLDLSHKPEFFI